MSKRQDFKYWFDDECDNYRLHGLALEQPAVFDCISSYQRVQIFDTLEFGKMLVLDGSPQSAEADERIYHEALVHPAGVLLGDRPKTVLILGGGEGATAREALRYQSVRPAITVDIDQVVVDASRKHLASMRKAVDEDERHRLIVGDAKEFLLSPQKFLMVAPYDYDLIISDINDPEGKNVAARCYAPEFFELAAKRTRGIFVMQSQQLSRVVWQGHKKHRDLLKQFFKHVYSYRRYVPSFNYEQSFILASNAETFNPNALQPLTVDNLIKERITSDKNSPLGKLEEFSGDMFCHMFALSPDLKKKLGI